MTRFRIHRALLVPAAAAALLVVPATTAMAASNSSSTSLSCTITVAGYITPGVTPQTQTVLVYSLGQSGTADCTGTIDGAAVTSPGRFGLVVEEDANCLTLSNGNGVFALTAPTASGTRTATGTFQINGPADTTLGADDHRLLPGRCARSASERLALTEFVCAQRGSVTDEPDVAEGVGEASLPVNAPWRFVVADLIDAAVRSGGNGAFDEAVGVVNEDLDSYCPCASSGWRVPAVAGRFAQEERGAVDGQPDDTAPVP
jgi:hypothetical protein